MFLELNAKKRTATAVIDDLGTSLSYGELCDFSGEFYSSINKKSLIFILSENCAGSLAGYVAALSSKVVPLMLSAQTDRELLEKLISVYRPEYIWLPKRMSGDFAYTEIFDKWGYSLLKTGLETFALNETLSLLLPTSGSTGSPKLVRHSYVNVNENARNVAALFELDQNQRAIAILPMHYTMGLSVVSSHLFAGATLLLVSKNLTDGDFWKFIKEQKATSFTGVPYSFEVLSKLRFFRMDLPELTLLTQGGGKLSETLFREYAEYAEKNGKRFIATYGQTEGTARMAYLPAAMAIAKTGSIGKAIPNGHLSLMDGAGQEITQADVTGEMVYRGPNVTLGYALNGEDLAKGDERNGSMSTGDIARKDADGYFYIVGRVSRFLKLYGFRISLDELEQMLRSAFNFDCMCTGNDDKMLVYITSENLRDEVSAYIVEKTGLFHKAFEILAIESIPRNEAGKIIY